MSTLVRTRQHGTEVHHATTAAQVAGVCRHILESGCAKINGELMDATTAGMIVSVWKAIEAQTAHPDFITKVEAKFASIYQDGTAERPRAALRWLVHFGWKLVR